MCKQLLDNILSVSAEANNYYPVHIFPPMKQDGESQQTVGQKCKKFLAFIKVLPHRVALINSH